MIAPAAGGRKRVLAGAVEAGRLMRPGVLSSNSGALSAPFG
jgi:hypothetical protein